MQSRLRRRLRRSFQFERAELVLGLGEYEERFRANKIDADVFADLADGDLEKLGLPLGDRKRFLKAVAGLAGLATRLEPTQAQPPGSTSYCLAIAPRRMVRFDGHLRKGPQPTASQTLKHPDLRPLSHVGDPSIKLGFVKRDLDQALLVADGEVVAEALLLDFRPELAVLDRESDRNGVSVQVLTLANPIRAAID